MPTKLLSGRHAGDPHARSEIISRQRRFTIGIQIYAISPLPASSIVCLTSPSSHRKSERRFNYLQSLLHLLTHNLLTISMKMFNKLHQICSRTNPDLHMWIAWNFQFHLYKQFELFTNCNPLAVRFGQFNQWERSLLHVRYRRSIRCRGPGGCLTFDV